MKNNCQYVTRMYLYYTIQLAPPVQKYVGRDSGRSLVIVLFEFPVKSIPMYSSFTVIPKFVVKLKADISAISKFLTIIWNLEQGKFMKDFSLIRLG